MTVTVTVPEPDRIHLEGMGVVGSFIAWTLDSEGIEFTWHDINDEVNAWRASTGTIYPDHDEHDTYDTWTEWYADPPWPPEIHETVTRGVFWFNHKNPPHGGTYDVTEDLGPLRRGEPYSYHVNVQEFVTRTREHFTEKRLTDPPHSPDDLPGTTIVTHGFGERNDAYYWGWSARVELCIDPMLWEHSRPDTTPCFYCKQGRFVMAYATPVPNTDPQQWYAGSSIIKQESPKPLDIIPKFETWGEHFHNLTGGLARVTSAHGFEQGWRPVNAEEDTAVVDESVDGVLRVRPMRASGLKLAPDYTQEITFRIT